MDAGTLVMARLHCDDISAAIRIVRQGYQNRRFSGAVPDYQSEEVSTKVVRIIASYIDFVNRVVWSKGL
jgi:UDP-N-acetylglucosamine 2-epimerase (non-hydrolysing)